MKTNNMDNNNKHNGINAIRRNTQRMGIVSSPVERYTAIKCTCIGIDKAEDCKC